MTRPQHFRREGSGGALAAPLVVALVATGAAIWPSSTAAVPAGSEGKIAFQRQTADGSYDIWVMDARMPQCNDGQDNDSDLLVDASEEGTPDCAGPDDNDETDASSAGLRPAARLDRPPGADDTEPAWAPLQCGTFACDLENPWDADAGVAAVEQVLAFASASLGGPGDIWAVDPNPGGPQTLANLTDTPTVDEDSPSFRRSGDLAFDSNANGSRDIWVMPHVGAGWGSRCRLAGDPAADSADDTDPEWSPDQTQIAFQRHSGGDTQIWVMDVALDNPCAASNARLVTVDQPPSFEPSWFHYAEAFGATGDPGHRIAFSGPGERDDSDIHYVEHAYAAATEPPYPFPDGASLPTWTLLDDPADDRNPSWSPHGAGLVLATNRAGNYDIYFLEQDGESAPVALTADPADELNPAIQPRSQADVAPRRICGRVCRLRRRRAQAATFPAQTPSVEPVLPLQPPQSTRVCTVLGTARNDRLRGTPQRDVMCGLGGNDRLVGLGGKDTLRGGVGRDSLYGGRGLDRVRGGRGRDRLFGGAGNDRLWGGPDPDQVFGQAGSDTIYGRGGGPDLLAGGSGFDRATFDRRDTLRRIESRGP